MSASRCAMALAAAAALLQGCAPIVVGAGGAAVYASYEDRRSTVAQYDDEAIQVRVSNRITDRYRDKVHINVNTFNRATLLTGEVPDQATRAELEKIALGVPNVRGVTNDVEVAGISTMVARTNDSYVTSKVKARFFDAGRFNPLHVKVVTEAGVVYLMGVVTEQEGNDAVEIARTTSGVRKVVKVLEYCAPTDRICQPQLTPDQVRTGKTRP